MSMFESATLITPTRDRPLCFREAEHYVRRMSWGGVLQWIVVDDGDARAELTMGQEYVRRLPSEEPHTLAQNLLAAVPLVRGRIVFVIEDDDWYAPHYLERMARYMRESPIVGEARSRYYHVPTRGVQTCYNRRHASLAATGFRKELLGRFRRACEQAIAEKNPFVDLYFWGRREPFLLQKKGIRPRTYFKTRLHLGLKGLPGRAGIASGHDPSIYREYDDAECTRLREWVGDDDARRILSITPHTPIIRPVSIVEP